MILLRWVYCTILFSLSVEAVTGAVVTPKTIQLGGLFQSFGIADLSYNNVREEFANQCLAAFVMAVDEINKGNKILPNTKINIISSLGNTIMPLFPINPVFEGAVRSYILRNKAPEILIAVDYARDLYIAQSTAQTLNDWGIIDFLTGSKSGSFVHKDLYPLTVQNTANQINEAKILMNLIANTYGWMNVALLYDFDTQNTLDGVDALIAAAAANGVKLLTTIPLASNTKNFASIIKEIIPFKATIYILLMSGTSAGYLLEQGFNKGLFHDGTQVLVTSITVLSEIQNALTPTGIYFLVVMILLRYHVWVISYFCYYPFLTDLYRND